MALAQLFNIPGDRRELDTWACAHAAHHRDLNDRIFALFNIKIQEYILDPVPENNFGQWLYQHQQMHQAMGLVLGLQDFDLTSLDPEDEGQLSGWIWLNAQVHREAATLLGV